MSGVGLGVLDLLSGIGSWGEGVPLSRTAGREGDCLMVVLS